MPSRNSVQAFATKRNRDVELLVEFILQKFAERLYKVGAVETLEDPILQKRFRRDDCSDFFDHYLALETTAPVGGRKSNLQLWAQTTCYKGNDGGTPESNKTYEIRETLVEALGLRRWLSEEETFFRTVHFTIGPANYTYGWFQDAKNRAFDLSLYPSPAVRAAEFFSELEQLTHGISSEFDFIQRLEGTLNSAGSQVGRVIEEMCDSLWDWYEKGLPAQPVADQQAYLLDRLRKEQAKSATQAVAASQHGGADIKARALTLLQGGETDDAAMINTVKRLNVGNPFLPAAAQAAVDWDSWSRKAFIIPEGLNSLPEYIRYLWNAEGDTRLIARRLLLRIHTDESVHYVQDTGIPGLTEHNLYGGDHTEKQVQAIVDRTESSCRQAGIRTPVALKNRLVSRAGLGLLNSSRRLEGFNGTRLRPSFFYVEEVLSARYSILSFRDTSLPSPVGYHDGFGTGRVRPYENMKVVTDKSTDSPVAVLKAKFFSRNEFPRRAKEEAYVGFTTKFKYTNGGFEERYPGIPLIMFADMERDLCPPEYAVRRLVTAGWEVFFSVDELKAHLASLTAGSSG